MLLVSVGVVLRKVTIQYTTVLILNFGNTFLSLALKVQAMMECFYRWTLKDKCFLQKKIGIPTNQDGNTTQIGDLQIRKQVEQLRSKLV